MKTTFNNCQDDLVNTLHTYNMRHSLIKAFEPRPFSNTGLKCTPPHLLEKPLAKTAFDYMASLGITTKQMKKDFYNSYPTPVTELIITDDGVKPVLIKQRRKSELCHIDTVSFTIGAETFDNVRTRGLSPDDKQYEIISQLSTELKRITGFGIGEELTGGKNYYERSFKMENETGLVSIGGQNNTILVQLNGTCAVLGKQGYELDIAVFLEVECMRGKITRLDIAYDDLKGAYPVEWWDQQESLDGFKTGGRPPSVEHRGNWKRPNGKGRTLYIGSRQSSKFTRIYEKGKEQGDKDNPWVRVETEIKAKHLFIPTEALVKPTEYFLALYPVFLELKDLEEDEVLKDFERKQQTVSNSFSKAVDITRHQFGRYLFAFRHFFNDKELLDMLMPTKNKQFPKRLDLLSVVQHKAKDDEKSAVMLLASINSLLNKPMEYSYANV